MQTSFYGGDFFFCRPVTEHSKLASCVHACTLFLKKWEVKFFC